MFSDVISGSSIDGVQSDRHRAVQDSDDRIDDGWHRISTSVFHARLPTDELCVYADRLMDRNHTVDAAESRYNETSARWD